MESNEARGGRGAGSGLRLVVAALALAVTLGATRPGTSAQGADTLFQLRQTLFDELQPVSLTDCTLERFGAERDGGYLLCGNLLDDVGVAYSYGIAGRDQWGCDISRRHDLDVHQYDCFNLTEPVCPRGKFRFHAECIGDATFRDDERAFDTLSNQVARNGDVGKRIAVKMDVEVAEWDALLSTPDATLDAIEQLAIEFHFVNKLKYLAVVRKLKRHFFIAHLHTNNYSCTSGIEPFPGFAYEVLFVNKRIATRDPSGRRPTLPHPLDYPNRDAPDCQPSTP